MKNFTTTIIDAEDGSGDGILQFPDGFMEAHDWREGDVLEMKTEGTSIIIKNLDWMKREGLHKQIP